jgi:hypothetical protein
MGRLARELGASRWATITPVARAGNFVAAAPVITPVFFVINALRHLLPPESTPFVRSSPIRTAVSGRRRQRDTRAAPVEVPMPHPQT